MIFSVYLALTMHGSEVWTLSLWLLISLRRSYIRSKTQFYLPLCRPMITWAVRATIMRAAFEDKKKKLWNACCMLACGHYMLVTLAEILPYQS